MTGKVSDGQIGESSSRPGRFRPGWQKCSAGGDEHDEHIVKDISFSLVSKVSLVRMGESYDKIARMGMRRPAGPKGSLLVNRSMARYGQHKVGERETRRNEVEGTMG